MQIKKDYTLFIVTELHKPNQYKRNKYQIWEHFTVKSTGELRRASVICYRLTMFSFDFKSIQGQIHTLHIGVAKYARNYTLNYIENKK